MRRVVMLAAALIASLVLAAPPASAATKPLPVPYNFLPAAILGGTPNANAPGTNDWSCKPTAEHPRPVVLVHGTFGNRSTNWQTYGPLLKNNGYCVFALTYGTLPGLPFPVDALGGFGDMRASAEQLRAFVDQVLTATGAAKVDLVGHSQGTLMPNYYVKFLGGAPVRAELRLAGAAVARHEHRADLEPSSSVFKLDPDAVPACTACGQMDRARLHRADPRRAGSRCRA